jgi:hypothetical protein
MYASWASTQPALLSRVLSLLYIALSASCRAMAETLRCVSGERSRLRSLTGVPTSGRAVGSTFLAPSGAFSNTRRLVKCLTDCWRKSARAGVQVPVLLFTHTASNSQEAPVLLITQNRTAIKKGQCCCSHSKEVQSREPSVGFRTDRTPIKRPQCCFSHTNNNNQEGPVALTHRKQHKSTIPGFF